MSDPYLGEIRMCGFNFAPRGWALCDGQLLPIAQNTALFSLLGTYYGGDGQVTFGLPDLRGRRTIGAGNGAVGNYTHGQKGGTETHTLTLQELASHRHTFMGSSAPGNQTSPSGNALATSTVDTPYAISSNGSQAHPVSTAGNPSPEAHDNLPPFLVVNFVIALEGIFPSRN